LLALKHFDFQLVASIIYADSINIVRARSRARFAQESLTFSPIFPFPPSRFCRAFWQFEWFWLSVIAFQRKKTGKACLWRESFCIKYKRWLKRSKRLVNMMLAMI